MTLAASALAHILSHRDNAELSAEVLSIVARAKANGVELEIFEDDASLAVAWNQRTGGKPGAGRRALQELLEHADAACLAVILDAHEGEPALVGLYASLGFSAWAPDFAEFGGEWSHPMRREPSEARMPQAPTGQRPRAR